MTAFASVEDALGNLEQTNNALVQQATGINARANSAVDNAVAAREATEVLKNAAQSSESGASGSKTAAATSASQSLTYRNETEALRDDATAVVTGGDGSIEPEPGKIPIAGSNAAIDHRWLGGEYIAHLLGAVTHAIDIASQAGREVLPRHVFEALSNEVLPSKNVEQLLHAIVMATDLASQASRAVGGGDVLLRDGTADNPALSAAADRSSGLYFPGEGIVALTVAGLEALRVEASGRLGIGTTAPSGLLDVEDDRVRVRQSKTPANSSAPGNTGELAWDADYIYTCTATNTWRRTATNTW